MGGSLARLPRYTWPPWVSVAAKRPDLEKVLKNVVDSKLRVDSFNQRLQ
jgi:hypothetical protein